MENRPRLRSTPKSGVRSAQTHDEWTTLIRTAIQLAEKSNDPRLPGLRAAQAEGRIEQHLRKLGIICPADLQREFPKKT